MTDSRERFLLMKPEAKVSPDEATTPRAGKPEHLSTDSHVGTGSGSMSKGSRV